MPNPATFPVQRTAKASSNTTHPLWLMIGFWLSVFIAIAVVVRRSITLLHPAGASASSAAPLDGKFSAHAALTFLHIIPAGLFVLLCVIILLRAPASRFLHWLFFALGAVTGITAYAMAAFATGGWIEQSAVAVFDTWFLFSLAQALRCFLQNEPVRQRRWTTRAVAILLGIATTRPVMGVFFATSRATHLTLQQFFGIAFWIGFSINAVAVELWLNRAPSEE